MIVRSMVYAEMLLIVQEIGIHDVAITIASSNEEQILKVSGLPTSSNLASGHAGTQVMVITTKFKWRHIVDCCGG